MRYSRIYSFMRNGGRMSGKRGSWGELGELGWELRELGWELGE